MTDSKAVPPGAARTDEPLATVVDHFDKSDVLCDWESLSGEAKEECIDDLVDDDCLREFISIRESLRKAHLSGDLDSQTHQMLEEVYETVDVMITNYICVKCCEDK